MKKKFIFLQDTVSPFTGKFYQKGEVIKALPEKVQSFVEQGTLGDYDLYEWCFNVCMLTEGQAKLCLSANSCPRFRK